MIVLGNSNTSTSPFVIGHGVMRDAIDAAAVIAALKSVGIGLDEIADPAARSRLVNIFAKAEASPTGSCADAATSCSTTPISVRPDMPARRRRADRRARRHRRRLCIRWCGASGAAGRRTGGSHRSPVSVRDVLQVQDQAIAIRSGHADHQAARAFRRRQHAVAMDRAPLQPIDLAGAANAAAARRRNIDAEAEQCGSIV